MTLEAQDKRCNSLFKRLDAEDLENLSEREQEQVNDAMQSVKNGTWTVGEALHWLASGCPNH